MTIMYIVTEFVSAYPFIYYSGTMKAQLHPVIRVVLGNGPGSIELFCQYDTHHAMRQGHAGNADFKMGA